MSETQATIDEWRLTTFGSGGTTIRAAGRANQEMAELLMNLAEDLAHPKAAQEVADIVICMYGVASRLGVDLHAEVDAKMAVNRARTWRLTGDGHGYHVTEGSSEK